MLPPPKGFLLKGFRLLKMSTLSSYSKRGQSYVIMYSKSVTSWSSADSPILFTTATGPLPNVLRAYFLFSFFKKKIFLFYFIFGCVGFSLLRAGLSLVEASGGYSSLQCAGFSLRWLLVAEHGL